MNRSHFLTAWALILLLGALACHRDDVRAELGGTDLGECLSHPETCRGDSALYAQTWGKP
jgi:hypothetical protein